MNAPAKFRGQVTLTSREFNQHTGRAKAAADHGPVVITDRGKPAYVLMTYSEFEMVSKKKPFVSLYDALVDPNAADDDFDLMDFIPKREIEPIRDPFADE